ncbi:transposon protein, putative, Mariner sub-class [Phytophthora cinnamomi]|uniref:transposon protein, putative, Mariner sub-class n=1 Tax=Phytophthora cinnamomi TaxID=4785 RepID=UPI00355A3361|nr:transposon protein, putative, Mariner sub-class [Phytophthora cinnamomi]
MPRTPNAKDLPLYTKLEIVLFLSDMATCGKLPRGAISEVTARFRCHRNTVHKLWSGRATIAVQRPSNRGRPRAFTDGAIKTKIESAPVGSRTTLRGLAVATGIPRIQLFHRLQERSVVRRVTVVPKPLLPPEHMAQRRQFARSFVTKLPDCGEKWFYVHRNRNTYYLTGGEPASRAVTKNKTHRTKVMFLVAVARPRYDEHQCMTFDGKVGLWPVVKTKLAVRSSKNLPKGTPVTTPVEMTKDVYERMLTQHVIPAIKRVWPGKEEVTIQQDNAPPHRASGRTAVKAAAAAGGWSIKFANQPPLSPDFNVLDLGWFNSLQSLQYKKHMRDVDGLIAAVKAAFEEMVSTTNNKCFLTLQSVLEASMLVGGGNSYNIPHLKKDALMRVDRLPHCLPCSAEAIAAVDA